MKFNAIGSDIRLSCPHCGKQFRSKLLFAAHVAVCTFKGV